MRSFYDEQAFVGVPLSDVAKSKLSANQLRMKPVDRRRMNRALLEDAYPELIRKHQWNTPKRKLANRLSLWGNANFALTLAAICAMLTLKAVRSLSWRSLGRRCGGLVDERRGDHPDHFGRRRIWCHAAGHEHQRDDQAITSPARGLPGIMLLLLGWGIAAVLKVAQGSSTVAMIVGAGMMAAIIGDAKPEYHMVYVATAVGTGILDGQLDERQRFLGVHQNGRIDRSRIAQKLDAVADGVVRRRARGHDLAESNDAAANRSMTRAGEPITVARWRAVA